MTSESLRPSFDRIMMIHPGLFARCCSFVPITWPSFVVSELPIIIRRLKNIYHLGKWQSLSLLCYVRQSS